jgi:hypothetical protein
VRDYGKVQTTFWTSDDIQVLSNDGRMLALYLLTSPHTNLLGCFHLPTGYVSEDLSWDVETVSKGFAELELKGFATRDALSKWVVIHKYLKWNAIENPNQGISAGRLFDQVPSKSAVKPLLVKALREYSKHFPLSILEEFETLYQTVPKPGAGTGAGTPTEAVAVSGTGHIPSADADVGKKPKVDPNPLNLETWKAYKQAYVDRYTVAPVRDAEVNAKIKSIVKNLGEEAPAVAAFFVRHNGRKYVEGMHQIGYLKTDYAKLRTEWATQTQMTGSQAAQIDKTQTNLNAFQPLIDAALAEEAQLMGGTHG